MRLLEGSVRISIFSSVCLFAEMHARWYVPAKTCLNFSKLRHGTTWFLINRSRWSWPTIRQFSMNVTFALARTTYVIWNYCDSVIVLRWKNGTEMWGETKNPEKLSVFFITKNSAHGKMNGTLLAKWRPIEINRTFCLCAAIHSRLSVSPCSLRQWKVLLHSHMFAHHRSSYIPLEYVWVDHLISNCLCASDEHKVSSTLFDRQFHTDSHTHTISIWLQLECVAVYGRNVAFAWLQQSHQQKHPWKNTAFRLTSISLCAKFSAA